MPARTFVFQDAKSHKFWSVAVEGAQVVTRWGRVGTDGQEKAKPFADEALAWVASEKLIAEKVRKGYVEDGAGGHPEPSIGTLAAAVAEPKVTPAPAPAAEPEPERGAEPAPPQDPDADRAAIQLAPHEWSIATWRPLHTIPDELPEPFDADAAMRRLREHVVEATGWWTTWARTPIGLLMTREEAAFWLRVTQQGRHHRQTIHERARELAARPIDVPSPDEAFVLALGSTLPYGDALGALVHLADPADIAEWFTRPVTNYDPAHLSHGGRGELPQGIRAHLLPRLADADRDRLADHTRGVIQRELATATDHVYCAEMFVAAQLGMHDEVEAVVATWSAGWGGPQEVVFGLRDADAVRAAVERLGIRLHDERDVAGWLAHTELTGLDVIERSVLDQDGRASAEAVLAAFGDRVHDSAAAETMAVLATSSRAPSVAKAWIDGHPAESVTGLAAALGRTGARGDAVVGQLQRLARTARPTFDAAVAVLDEARRAAVQTKVLDPLGDDVEELTELPDWLVAGLDAARGTRLPAWLNPAELPPLVVDGGRLPAEHVPGLLKALATIEPEAPIPPFVRELAEHADPARADAFAWSLFQAWLSGDAPPKGRWAMLSVGPLGTDRSASRLEPLIRAWPGESQHKRAVLGLAVLQEIGTDHALMLLNGIAQKVKFKALKERAREAMDEIAQRKGMTSEELADRIVPDCGLDEQGRRTFDYGPRQFEFVLGEGMKSMVRDASGKVRTSPPKPGAKDDAALAEQAREDWKLLRKQVGDVAKIQAQRLESAMVTGRRWSAADFRAFLVDHPLQRHLTRLLVLGAWEGDRGPTTFRLTEEGDFADAQDEPFALADDAEVSVVHPLQLGDDERAAWGELLADYELVPPFAQLGRSVYDIEPGERGERDLTRFAKLKVPAITLVGILERSGWDRGTPQDAGLFHTHSRYFRHADVSAVVSYDGIPVGYMVDWDDQAIEHCYVVRGKSDDVWGWEWDRRERKRTVLRWGDVDPIVRSEVLRTLHAIAAKAR